MVCVGKKLDWTVELRLALLHCHLGGVSFLASSLLPQVLPLPWVTTPASVLFLDVILLPEEGPFSFLPP